MPESRILVLAAIMAGLSGTSVRADTILTLGVFSSGSTATSPASTSSSSGTGFTLGQATVSGPSTTSSGSNTSVNLAGSGSTDSSITPSASTFTALSSVSTPSQATYDAFINLGAGPYANASSLTTGNALPWYDSSPVIGLFGGQPTVQQRTDFDNVVLQRVEQTFKLSGVPITLTDDPKDFAAHTMSVVSNTVNPNLGNAIGMTNLGGNGFHFIDNSATAARSVDQLEWIVAHNVAHELMLAFGVPETHDQSGNTVNSTMGQLAMFLNPKATFSKGAVQDLLSKDFLAQDSLSLTSSPQLIDPATVPEPTTLVLWGLGALTVLARRSSGIRRKFRCMGLAASL